MVALATKEPLVSALSKQFDTDPMLLNVQNGTIDLRTGELRAHLREDMLAKVCPLDYDPSATCPRWLSFLGELFADHPEIMAFLQRSLGYSLTGLTDEQCFWLLIGPGNNGKSVFVGVIQFVLGDYAVETSFNTFVVPFDSRAINPRDGLACLEGSRFVRASESDEGKRISEALLKTLTGGEQIRTARLYAEDFAYRPTFKIWLSSNHAPTIRGTDEGIWRRIHRVNFDYVVPQEKRDRRFGDKLKAEAPGILNWGLEGLKAYLAGGLQVPESVKSATTCYRNAQNLIYRFIESARKAGAESEATTLYEDFKQWCIARGEAPPTQTAFGIEAKKHLRTERNGSGRTVYFGVKAGPQTG
jgi:putative DNA primase/helicase